MKERRRGILVFVVFGVEVRDTKNPGNSRDFLYEISLAVRK